MAIYNFSLNNINCELSYEILNPKAEKTVLILHGWGANKELMKQSFADSFKEFKHIYVDLPGFGKSQSSTELNSFTYCALLAEFIRKKNFKIDLVMGHSFGGKLSVLLAREFKIPELILLSSAGIRWEKSLKVKLKIAIFKVLKFLGLSKFRKYFASKDVANMNELMYKTFKNVVDEDFSEYFASLQSKTFIFWGKDDSATPLKSGEKIHSLVKHSKLYTVNGGHFFFMKEAKYIDETYKQGF